MANFDIQDIVQGLTEARHHWRVSQNRNNDSNGREFPSRDALVTVITLLKGVLFPLRLGPPDLRQESENYHVAHALDTALHILVEQVHLELKYSASLQNRPTLNLQEDARRLTHAFGRTLPDIRRLLDTDVLAAYHGDPAARSVDEVLLCYPGILAMIHFRLANCLYKLGAPLLARMIAEQAHAATGIDIHPGAVIGSGFFVDHGTGVVIGETTVIGNNVRIYQAVTLGAKRFPVDIQGKLEKGLPRHPIVEDDVVIYAGATILGRIVLGRGAVIGGNVWLTHDVPAGAHISQAASREDPSTLSTASET